MATDKDVNIKVNIKSTGEQSETIAKDFGIMDTQIGRAAKSALEFGKAFKTAMMTVKGALISTGIGALVVVVGSLVAYFTKTEEGAKTLKVVMSGLGTVMNMITNIFASVGKFLVGMTESTASFKDGLKELGKIILDNIINRFTAFAVLGKAIIKILKGDLKEGLTELADGAIQLTTGVTDATDKMKSFGKELKDNYDKGKALGELENELALRKRTNLVEESKLMKALADTKLKMDDATKTELERLKEVEKASRIQQQITDERIATAQAELDIANMKIANGDKSTEALNAQAEAEKNLFLAQAEGADKQKEFADKKSAIVQKGLDEKKKTAEEEIKSTQEQLDKEYALAEEQLNKEDELYKSFKETKKQLDEENYLASLETDEERAQKKLDLEKTKFEEELANSVYTEEQKATLLLAYQKKYENDSQQLAKDNLNKQKIIDNALKESKLNTIMAISNMIGSLGGLMSELAEGNKDVARAGLIIEKAAAIGTIIASTAMANAKAVAASPLTGGQPWVAINTISASISVASLIASTAKQMQEINTAKTEKKALGGWLGGPSHQNGGVTVNAEGGEFIVNKRTMQNPYLAQTVMNANSIGNGGMGSASMLSEERVAEIAAKVVSAIPVYVVENDMTETQRKVQVRESAYVQ